MPSPAAPRRSPPTWTITDDRLSVGIAELRLADARRPAAPDAGGVLAVKKSLSTLADYERLLESRPDAPVASVLELGMWSGGSVVLWAERLAAGRISGVDLSPGPDPDPLVRYRAQSQSAVRTHWAVDQADRAALRRIVATDGLAPLDMVIDDASHLPGPTVASFETLFPLVRPGGLYVIEDWNWCYVEPTRSQIPEWRMRPPLGPLAGCFTAACASRPDVIASVLALPTLLVLERGSAEIDGDAALGRLIARRPDHRISRVARAAQQGARSGGRLVRDQVRGVRRSPG